MLLKDKIENLKTFIKSDNVLANLEERYCYTYDACNLEKEGITPDLVIFVETIKDVQKVLEYANKHEIPVISRGAGTNMVGSCVCTSGGIILNFSKMNKIIEINPVNFTAKVQPGVILGDLKTAVEEFGLFFPPDPSNHKVSTIGGAIAQSSGGAMSFKYGSTKDYVLSLKVVTAEGKIMTLGAETSKDSTGYHLNQLIVGSEGTLAIVVEATLKLIPKPQANSLIVAYFNDIESVASSVNKILNNGIFPASIDFMDKNSIVTVEEFSKIGLKTTYECLLLINLDGTDDSLKEQKQMVANILKETNAKDVFLSQAENDTEKIFRARASSFAATARLAPDVISEDLIVPRSNLTKMIYKCNEVSAKYNLKMCLVAHFGDGNLHPQFALNMNNETEFRNYQSAKSEIYDYVIKLGGTISAEHGVGLEKKDIFQNNIDQNALEYMKLVKKAFDPKNILNPGKIFEL